MSASSSSSSALPGPPDPQSEVVRLTLQIESLNREGNALMTDHRQLQAQVAHLQAAAVPVPVGTLFAGGAAGPIVPPMRGTRAAEPKIPTPHEFKGAIGHGIDEWILFVNRYMDFMPEGFATEARKMTWAEMYLSADVTSWLNAARLDLANEGKAVDTWVKLQAVLRERYQPMEAAVFARQRLDKISQTGSVSAYNEYFLKNLQYLPHMDVGDRIHHYVKGLKEGVRTEVIRRNPKSIHDAMHYAIGAEAYGRQSYQLSSHGSGRFQRGSSHHGASTGATGMDLSNINSEHYEDERESPPESPSQGGAQLLALEQKLEKMYALMSRASGSNRPDRRQDARGPSGGGTRVDNVSRADYIKCREKNVCLKCKEPNHVAKDCTKAFKPVPSNW